MLFSEVIGNSEVKLHLRQMAEQNRVSHALLFLGAEGSGALPLAFAFAQYMVCEKAGGRRQDGFTQKGLFGEAEVAELPYPPDSCGLCPSCQKMATLVHPDVHLSFPVFPRKSGDKPIANEFMAEFRAFCLKHPYGNSFDWLQFAGAENRQGNIPVAEIEDIARKLSLKSFEGGYKILVLWMPELLGWEGNRMLKLLEEPPPGTLFLLVGENDELILPTILSRTQLIKIKAPDEAELEQGLEKVLGLPPNRAAYAAQLAEGNIREAIEVLDHAEVDHEKTLRDWLNTIISTGPGGQIKWLEEMGKQGREQQKQFLKYVIKTIGTCVRLQAVGPENMPGLGMEKNKSLLDLATRLNKLCDVGQFEAMARELENAIYYIERNANGKLLFHALTIRIYHIIRNKTVILVN